jgi:hypothetical protein
MLQCGRSRLAKLLVVLSLTIVFQESLFATPADDKGQEQGFLTRVDNAIGTGQLELIPLMITGDKDNRINIVVMNRWERDSSRAYNKKQLREEFLEDALHVVKASTAENKQAIPPYPHYRNFFNIYAVW